MLLKSIDRAETWEEISPDLTTNDSVKIAGKGHMMYCTLTTISESPVEKGEIWVGTDDGKVYLTANGEQNWSAFTQNLEQLGAKADRWVTRVFASNHNSGKTYVCKSGFKFDDFKPYVFKTKDYGKTWIDIAQGLPESPVNVIIEDHRNPNLLFVGNDLGVYFSLDGGASWQQLKGNMPIVPVKDLVVHPRENDLVIGTYGRGLYLTNINFLQQIEPDILNSDFSFFEIQPKPKRNMSEASYWGNNRLMGDNHLFTPNELNGIPIGYWLKEPLKKSPELIILNDQNIPVDTLEASNEKGLNQVHWHTWEQEPGTYRVRTETEKGSYSKSFILKEAPQFPILNYRKPQ